MKRIMTILFSIIIILSLLIYFSYFVDIKVNINGFDISLKYNNNDTIYLSSFSNETSYAKVYSINTVKVNNQRIFLNTDIDKININDETSIQVEVRYLFGNKKIFNVQTLHPKFPPYYVTGESKYEGDYYLSNYNSKSTDKYFIFKLNNKGELIYYKLVDDQSFDFKKTIIDNKVYYSYLEKYNNDYPVNSTSYVPCKLVIMDENYSVIKELKYDDENDIPLGNHDSILLSLDNYIIDTFEEVKVDTLDGVYKNKDNQVTINKIKEVKNGDTLWEFNSLDYHELYDYFSDEKIQQGDSYKTYDYMHLNSCTIDKSDNNLICSFRNIDSIIKISRNDGKLMWILGGKGDMFGLTQKQKFYKQHAVTYMDDGSILLFDNNDYYSNSRILRIKLDEANKKVVSYDEIDLSLNSVFMGNAQYLDNNTYLVCYGGISFNNVIEEINFDTKEVEFSFNFIDNSYVYRVYKE